MKDKFAGKHILLTGASGGIGSAIASAFAKAGGIITATDLSTDMIDADHKIAGDLTDPLFANELVKQAHSLMGGIDILVNNAGIIRRGKVTESSDDDLRLSLAVNVEAPFRLCRQAIPIMAAQGGGNIVNIASCWGVHPGPNHALYCMTKGAVASLTQAMGLDHGQDKIRINAVCPNEVNTAMLRTGFAMRGFDPDKAVDDLNKTVPLGRIAEPDDIADVVTFLASDASRYICGSLIEVNGGKRVS